MNDEKNEGIVHKYDVKRVNDPEGKHDDCWYFVLDPQHDPIAQIALREYLAVAQSLGYAQLADDIKSKLAEVASQRLTQ
jgi:hypothetical protein